MRPYTWTLGVGDMDISGVVSEGRSSEAENSGQSSMGARATFRVKTRKGATERCAICKVLFNGKRICLAGSRTLCAT